MVGTVLYPNNEKVKIKKSKIRGEISNGMICGQDELNLGEYDDGIMILDDKLKLVLPFLKFMRLNLIGFMKLDIIAGNYKFKWIKFFK